MNRAELKSKAKQQLRGKYGILFVITLIIAVISSVAGALLSLIPFGGIVATIVITPAFSLSVVSIYLSITEGLSPDVSDAFGGFSNFWGAFKVSFLVGLFTYLWSLLFIITGIVSELSYSMSMFVLSANEVKGA
ncbi:MAG: DUF975 family protein, partial [Clostridia bacterium]|nr:DUF975 family protein [Clostridia bacterium]